MVSLRKVFFWSPRRTRRHDARTYNQSSRPHEKRSLAACKNKCRREGMTTYSKIIIRTYPLTPPLQLTSTGIWVGRRKERKGT